MSISPIQPDVLRGANLCQILHWLALGQVSPQHLVETCRAAIEADNRILNAFVDFRPGPLQAQVRSAIRRREQGVLGRLDGIPVAIKDNMDIAGWPTGTGLPQREVHVAIHDAHVVRRLRAAGAIIMGKTNLDEGCLGSTTDNPHYGATHHPLRHGYTVGGSSGGTAAAVAAGMAVVGIGSDSLGSIRIPASYCGLYALKPTHGEISTEGMVPAVRRLDTVGLIARSAEDLPVLLQVLAGYDACDPFSRYRRVAFELPDWNPGHLRTGVLPDLGAWGVSPEVQNVFYMALDKLAHELGERHTVDFSDWKAAEHRRSGLLLMEAEMGNTFTPWLNDQTSPVSESFRKLIDYAGRQSALDCAKASLSLDETTLKMRRLFAQVDVLVMPTTPQGAFPLEQKPPSNQANLTAFASLAGCPAVTLPMGFLPDGMPVGMQLVGPRGADLRLLELAAMCASALDAEPEYPLVPAND